MKFLYHIFPSFVLPGPSLHHIGRVARGSSDFKSVRGFVAAKIKLWRREVGHPILMNNHLVFGNHTPALRCTLFKGTCKGAELANMKFQKLGCW